uniref:Uncharacterized protein n=1 Tax=Setaria viridis TaxID=4556 RepID=A0A4U6WDX8_SETVI|nr:hypothetical protein SEVIR_1G237750v2 [Setaria viridis]
MASARFFPAGLFSPAVRMASAGSLSWKPLERLNDAPTLPPCLSSASRSSPPPSRALAPTLPPSPPPLRNACAIAALRRSEAPALSPLSAAGIESRRPLPPVTRSSPPRSLVLPLDPSPPQLPLRRSVARARSLPPASRRTALSLALGRATPPSVPLLAPSVARSGSAAAGPSGSAAAAPTGRTRSRAWARSPAPAVRRLARSVARISPPLLVAVAPEPPPPLPPLKRSLGRARPPPPAGRRVQGPPPNPSPPPSPSLTEYLARVKMVLVGENAAYFVQHS